MARSDDSAPEREYRHHEFALQWLPTHRAVNSKPFANCARDNSMRIVDLNDPSIAAVGRSWRVGGVAILIATAVASGGNLFALVWLPFTCLGAYLALRGRKLRARALAAHISADERAPVIYLRAFKSDPSFLDFLKDLLSFSSMEEQLAEVIFDLGPFIAVGKPGEKLPEPGAARIYLRPEVWQEIVSEKLEAAKLIILRADTTAGLWWEFNRCRESVRPERILLLVFQMRRADYNTFATHAWTELGILLPLVKARFGRVSGFIGFSSSWEPNFIDLNAPYLHRTVFKRFRPLFKFALKSIYEREEVRWVAPTIPFSTFVGFVALGVLALGVMGMLVLIAVEVLVG